MPRGVYIKSEAHRMKLSESTKKAWIDGKLKSHPQSIETRNNISRRQIGQTGENCRAWKGDKVGYWGIHRWVTNTLGKHNKCDNCGTTEAKRYEWANISRKYKREVSDWIRLCCSCHYKYDRKGEQLCK